MLVIRPIVADVLAKCETDDLLRWCWEDEYIREAAKNRQVWRDRWVPIGSLLTIKLLSLYYEHVDSVELSECPPDVIVNLPESISPARLSVKANSEITDDAVCMVLRNNGHNVRFVDMSGCLALTNKSLIALSVHCSLLTEINLSNTLFSYSGLLALTDRKSIEHLSIQRCILLSADCLLSLLPLFENLQSLDLQKNSSTVTIGFLTVLLPMLPKLRRLDVRGCDDLTRYQIERITQSFPHIQIKHDCKIYDDSVESIRTYLLSMIAVAVI